MINIGNLKNAYSTLKECYYDYKNNMESSFAEYICDACVKRYEYTFETAWKLAKKILQKQYGKNDIELTMNNIFRYMEGYGYTQHWEHWKTYYQERNNTAHEYNIQKSRALIELVPQFLEDVEFFINKLEKEQNDD